VAVHRSSSAVATAYRNQAPVQCARVVVQRQCDRHRVRQAWSKSSPLCSSRPAARNRDASLSVFAVRARCAGARRVGMLRGNCFGSGHRPAATTRPGESARTPRRSTDDHGRSGGRCAPVARSAGSCTADSSPCPPSCTPHAALDNAAKRGHKGSATASLCRASMLKARESFERVPGPSLIRRLGTSIAQAQSRQAQVSSPDVHHRSDPLAR
jgi:hypothetical protein